MNDIYLKNYTTKAHPMVDFNYKIKDSKTPRRRSIFQILSPKKNSKNLMMHNNPKEIFNANNKINSILSKNLKSIYNENKNNISSDNPLYKSVNCLIKKNHNSNKFLYSPMFNFKNYNTIHKRFNHKETDYSYVNTISEKEFQSGESTSKNKMLKPSALSVSPVKNANKLRKQLDNSPICKQNKKSDYKFPFKNKGIKSSKNMKTETLNNLNKRNSWMGNFKFGLKKNIQLFGTEATVGNNNDEIRKLVKENSDKNKKRASNFFRPDFHSGYNSSISNNKEIKSIPIAKKIISPSLSQKRFSLKTNNSNMKINSNLSTNSKGARHSLFINSPNKNMKMLTLKEISNTVTKSYIKNKMKFIKKELEDFENDEISEIINSLPRAKSEKKKNNNLSKLNSKSLNDSTSLIELKELPNSQTNTNITNNRSENLTVFEDDRFQKKYRKLFLNKNLYDSLDDEEAIDEEKIYHFHISTNSPTVYILDTLILIASFIELFYLPIYISLHISSFTIYHNLISSIIFYLIDFIYIIDLITGFFRSYYNFEEILIKRNLDICINYLTGWFILDLIEAIPFFTFLDRNMSKLKHNYIALNNNYINMFDFGLNNKYFALTMIKLIKIFKIFTSNRAVYGINKFLENSQFFYEWKGLFYTILISLSTLHVCSCFFIFIGKNEAQGWIINSNLQDSNFINIYITALYCQMTTFTTVGYGDISAKNGFEKIYGIFMLMVGTCAYSWILTYISNYIKKNNEKFIDFEEKMNVLNEIKLEYPNLGKNLYDSIIRYLNYNKSEYKCNLKFILESLPSSLQNNLIIEIYKPIIKNFQFFKSFENSDFFVKIVTSLKPILSMKDDILIQEGDIIEDIIFIKNGVLTLEIIIDLSKPKKSVESHLKMTAMNCYKNISDDKFTTLMNLSTLNSNYKTEFSKPLYNEKYTKKKEIKIIDLRKNEHFGDILMILNEKSPLTVKVKSKKAELFFLEKTEATEISNRYPNIWKRIVNKSLHNMKQIKSLIKKKVFLFIEMYNININQQLKEKYLKNEKVAFDTLITNLNQKNKNIASDIIETIIEEDESIKSMTHRSEKNTNQNTNIHIAITDGKNKKHQKNKNRKANNWKDNKSENNNQMNERKYLKNKSLNINNDIIKEKTEGKHNFRISRKTVSFKEIKSSLEINKNINSMNDMINMIDQEVKKSSKNKNFNTFNINIYTPKVQIPINQIKIENHNTSKNSKEEKEEINNSSNLGKINSEISYENDFVKDIKYNDILMDNYDENSNIFLLNKISTENKENLNNNDKNDSNIKKLFEKKDFEKITNNNIRSEKGEIKTNDKVSIKSVSSDKSKIANKKQNDFSFNLKNKFSLLDTSLSTSFTINSSYENINEISKYKYHQSPDLREKTKKFILEQLNKETEEPKSLNITKNNNNFLSIKYNMKINTKKIVRKNSENIGSNRKTLNKTASIVLPDSKKSFVQGMDNKIHSRLKSSKSIKKKDEILSKNGEESPSGDKFCSQANFRKSRNKSKKHISVRESEKNFYHKINRIKPLKKKNLDNKDEIIESEIKNTQLNYDKIISKNIEKNQKNLNNPEEYFEGFFNDIIFNTKNNNLLNKVDIKKKKTFQ